MVAVIRPAEIRIRRMTHRDLADVADLERRAYPFPWSEGIFRDCLLAGYFCLVLEVDGTLHGYAIVSVAAGEAHLLNLCIDPDLRRQGHARAMLAQVLEYAELTGVSRLFLEVRPSNEAAVRLYRQAGFSDLAVRPNYYRAASGREDALVLYIDIKQ